MEKKEDRDFCPGEDKRKMRRHNCPDKSPVLSMRQKDLSFDISLKTKDLVHFHSGRGLFSSVFFPSFLLYGGKENG